MNEFLCQNLPSDEIGVSFLSDRNFETLWLWLKSGLERAVWYGRKRIVFKLFIANAKPEVNSFDFFGALVGELSSERLACDRIVLLRSRMKALGMGFFLFTEGRNRQTVLEGCFLRAAGCPVWFSVRLKTILNGETKKMNGLRSDFWLSLLKALARWKTESVRTMKKHKG